MTSQELRKKFLKFFENKGHVIVPSSSLIPDDQSVLLTTAGMQQFASYLSGQIKSSYKTACSVQKCFRTDDIDEVGDDTHHTFFEMLGNWSFGDYFKKDAIKYALEFLIKECNISKEKLAITIFQSDKQAYNLWIKAGFTKEKIFKFGMKDNFWGPTGLTGPCGPCSEIHYDKTGKSCGDKCGPNCSCGRYVEIWNLVFMEYNKNQDGSYSKLSQKNIDTGIGFERLLAVLQNKNSAYETDLFKDLISSAFEKKTARIFADHSRAICFLIADGITPSNTDRGYILRRLIRRLIGQTKILKLENNILEILIKKIIKKYKNIYPELENNNILEIIKQEKNKFSQTIEKGIKQFEKGEDIFKLYSTYGLPFDMIKDLSEKKGIKINQEEFEQLRKKHQEISRAGAEKKFGGHGLGEARIFEKGDEKKVKKLHTATHLLHQALQDVLGNEVKQMGSDITSERLRFDFSHQDKLTPEQIKQVENIVNQKIKDNLEIKCEEMDKNKAIQSGAKAFFKAKYGNKVKVYSIQDYSKEICAGPHAEQTGELGIFKIIKEQSSSAGIRRIKAVLNN